MMMSRNPYFIGINSAIMYTRYNPFVKMVAILILLELTLQFRFSEFKEFVEERRNPYFIGINSAIQP